MRALLLSALTLAACVEGQFVGGQPGLAGEGGVSIDPQSGPAPSIPALPSAARCGDASSGRAWLGLSGEHLELGRLDRAAFVDVARPYRNLKSGNDWTVTGDITASIGGDAFTAPESRDPGTGGAFGVVPDRWYDESIVGPFAVYVSYAFAFKACLASFARPTFRNTAGWYEHVKFAPTPERARQFCDKTQRSAWLRAPSEEELAACTALALNLEEEPDVGKRWAYVCASVVTSMNWLSY
ncbi:MAG: hypothetical protein IAE78_18000 [Myxococcus sp.]|nr:hypothetical protein [Myxococcus sp.]